MCVRGLLLPSYSYCAKVAYMLQGAGACGLVLPDADAEKVMLSPLMVTSNLHLSTQCNAGSSNKGEDAMILMP
ncbi:hypothetical protein ZWY2020_025940 [Hordeum vulgare]|nr:hypothetical protein ZWY2020_025940 [Hordeum vulgare]